MPNLNKVLLIGNLTRDPELRFTPSGLAIARFGLAVNRRSKSQDGTQREEVLFIDVEAYGKQAELCSQYLAKGRCVYVGGRLKLDQWEGKDGQKQSRMKVVLEEVQFLSPRDVSAPPKGAAKEAPPAEVEGPGSEELTNTDEPPF